MIANISALDEKEFCQRANTFLNSIFDEINRLGIVLDSHWSIDHLCYRTSSLANYEATKDKLSQFSILLIESKVNGRAIATFKLPRPITFMDWEIDVIEVPAPKLGKVVKDGFEHFEVVCDLSFAEIKTRYFQCKFDESGLAKDFNQELEVELGEYAFKFHHLSLESVINLESNSLVNSAIKQSQVLNKLKIYQPLVAGTFPLKLNLESSDVDVLIAVSDFHETKRFLMDHFANFKNFMIEEINVEEKLTLFSAFEFQGIKFEIFGQQVDSIKQKGYLHFLVEERMLKIGGSDFYEKVYNLRRQGLKTEPAFARALNIAGDPYLELIRLQKLSNAELKALF